MKFLIDNKISNTTLGISSGAVHSELPVDNVKETSKSRITRSTNASSFSIIGNLIDPANVTGFVIGGHNFTTGTTYQLILYSLPDQGGTPISYTNSGPHTIIQEEAAINTDEFQYNIPIWIEDSSGNPVYVSSFKLSLLVGTSTLSYFQIGRLFLGEAIELNIGVSFGHNIYWKENSSQYRTEAGTLRTDIFTPSKVLEFSLNTIYESERSNLQRSLASIGKRTEFYISLFPGDCLISKELEYSGIVKMTKIPRFSEFATQFYSSKYVVEEI